MKRLLLLITFMCLTATAHLFGQNVFDPTLPLVQYSSGAALGSAQKPNPDQPGLQRWVHNPTKGVSGSWSAAEVQAFKAYFMNQGGNKMAFRLKFPKSYATNPTAKFPLMLFFHGLGEAGCPSNGGVYNNEKQLLIGARDFARKVEDGTFDGFLLYPQVVAGNNCVEEWSVNRSNKESAINAMLDSLAKYARLDVDRVVVNGLSDGGTQVFTYTRITPRRVAAAAPSSATTSASFATFVHIPIWFATGGKDSNPSPQSAQNTYNNGLEAGANIRYTLFPNGGHGIWNDHWRQAGYMEFLASAHKANPLVFYQRYEFCPEDPVEAKLGITSGFNAYEWDKDGVLIARRINGNNTVFDANSVVSYDGNEITVNKLGTYRVRFRRLANGPWSEWSPTPAVIREKPPTTTPPIQVAGIRSKVLPAPDGSNTVPLTLPDGWDGYQWYNAINNTQLSTDQVFNAPVGEYKAQVVDTDACSSVMSPVFKVVSTDGNPKPDPARNLTATAISQVAIQLDWNQNPNAGNNETGFEIYRSTSEGGPYTLIHITAPDVSTYQNTGLPSNATFYYIVRAVNDFGAAAVTNEASAITQIDQVKPTVPVNLQYRGSNANSVSLRWGSSTDAAGIKRYDVYANGQKMVSSTSTTTTVYGLDSLTFYTFTVRAVDNNDNISEPSNQVVAYTHRQGNNYKYYTGSWTSLPNFNNLTPVREGFATDVTTGTAFRTQSDNYGIMFDGWIYIPVTGTYSLGTRSDDGSRLYLDQEYSPTATPLVDNDGLHGATTVMATVNLTQGYHRIITTYFDATGSEFLQLRIRSADAGYPNEEKLPATFLSRDNPEFAPAPATPANLQASPDFYNLVNLSWTNPGGAVSGFEIQRATSATGTYSGVATVAGTQTTYGDSSVIAARSYWYRVRAIMASSSSEYSEVVQTRTPNAPSAPASPNNLSATLIEKNVIRVRFNDRASDETGYEIQRSVGSANAFRKIAELGPQPGGNVDFIDSSLFSNATYYYRARAIGAANFSGFSNTSNASTGNEKPEFENIQNFFVRFGTTYTLNVRANDPDGDVLEFRPLNFPNFARIEEVSNGNINVIFTPRMANQGTYTLRLVVDDGNQGLDTAVFRMSVNSNAAPSLTPVSDITMREGDSLAVAVSANDAGGNSKMIWMVRGMPSFGTFTNNGNGNGTITLKPWFNHSGVYAATLVVDDGSGAWTSQDFSITVENVDTTVNDGTTPVKPLALKAEVISNSGIRLTWEDRSYNEADYQVYRSTTAEGPFTIVNAGTNLMNQEEYTDESVAPFTRYFYYIAGVNSEGSGASSDTVSATTGNQNPVISTIADVSVKADASVLRDFTVSDDPADVVTVSIRNKPSFVILQNTGGNNYRITLSPTMNNVGWYNFTVDATDDKGGSSSVTFRAVVTDKKTRSVFVNLGSIRAPQPWNNLANAGSSNATLNNLIDETGTGSGFGITMVDSWNTSNTLGHLTGNNTGVFPDSVLASGVRETGTGDKEIRFTGLNPARRYNLVFVGSRNEGLDSRTEFRIGSSSNRDTLQSRYNVRATANLNNLTPNASGQISVEVKKLSGTASYLNAIAIEEFLPADALMSPSNLYAEPLDRSSVKLIWSDRMANENIADGFQLQRATDPGFNMNVVTTDLPANTSEYTSTGLADNTRYYFRVRTKTGASFTDYSNVAQTITPRSIVYVNFNFNVASSPSPWNNLENSPNLEDQFNNLQDQEGNNSGLSLSIVSIFNGEFNLGRRTGNNSGVVPDNVLAANYWLDRTQLSQMKLSGLNHTKRYRIGFIGSSGPSWAEGNYTATYTIGDRTVYLNSWQNTTKIVYIGDVVPDANGDVMLNFSTTEEAVYGFNAGLIIHAYDDVPGGGTILNRMDNDNNGVLVHPASPEDVNSQAQNFPVKIYPNPFRDELRVDFFNEASSGLVSVEIFDMSGRLAYRKNFGQLSKGAQTLRFNPGSGRLRSGVYMMTLSIDGKAVQTGKILRSE